MLRTGGVLLIAYLRCALYIGTLNIHAALPGRVPFLYNPYCYKTAPNGALASCCFTTEPPSRLKRRIFGPNFFSRFVFN